MHKVNDELSNHAQACYQLAEKKAAVYFQTLYEQVKQKAFFPVLTKDIHVWKQTHFHPFRFLPSFLHRKRPRGDDHYIQWLNYTGKLDEYLERSISYIFMRDLGKALDSHETQLKVRRTVDSLKSRLTAERGEREKNFSMADLYRWAQREGIESTVIWLLGKLKTVFAQIPTAMDPVQGQRKLIKIIAGVMMHVMEEMDDFITRTERSRKLDEAIRLGYAYGLTYPFIDDLLDSECLTNVEKKRFSNLIRTTLLTGTIPDLGDWPGENRELIERIYSELRAAFWYIESHQQPETRKHFFGQSYVFFQSQEVDRVKSLSNPHYSNEEIYIPIILKSSSSRLIVRSVISAPEDEACESRTFFYGIYNQLADDFADMFDDMKEGAVTPYTYYFTYHDKRSDLINPFELYWAVIFHLIHNVYHSDFKTREVILNRAINGLKRFKERIGKLKYKEVMERFAVGNEGFDRLIENMVRKAANVDFFDKLLRDHLIALLKREQREQEEFLDKVETFRNEIDKFLDIPSIKKDVLMDDPILQAANYSLKGEGKRLRPIVAWVMAVDAYGLNSQEIVPLLKSLEYMHTASLIFDDLPTQDNASIRRGRATLHRVYNTAIGELTGLFLTQKAIEVQTFLEQFDTKIVLQLIRYSAQVTELMCKGQAMDLGAKGKPLTIEQLDTLSFYKTGIAFEASLLMPAILAQAKETEMAALKKFARHAGIAFQIKDDLLDFEGDGILLGKPVGKDAENRNSTFVSILGLEGARKQMWEQYCLAMEALQEVPRNTAFLKHLLNYIVNREH